MKKEELEEKLKEAESRNKHYQENRDRYNVILKKLFEKANSTMLEKLDLCFDIYNYIRIKRIKENGKWEYIFETPIKMGWSSIHAESLEMGIEKLLNKN